MTVLRRHSPIEFDINPLESIERNGWEVAVHYPNEDEGPLLIDLSHRTRWDVQNSDLGSVKPWGRTIPEKPGESLLDGGLIINRQNRTQASIWHLFDAGNEKGDLSSPDESFFTETTDAQAWVALVGSEVPAIMEQISSLDLFQPDRTPPYLIQGPILNLPCQAVVLEREKIPAVLITFSRGYGQTMTKAILQTGRPYHLRPGGEGSFAIRLGRQD